MKIPDTVKIGAHIYEIVKTRLPNEHGVCQSDTLKIYIDNEDPITLQEETLIHEAIHAIREQLGLKSHDDDEEEGIVQPLAHAIYQFLKDNNLI